MKRTFQTLLVLLVACVPSWAQLALTNGTWVTWNLASSFGLTNTVTVSFDYTAPFDLNQTFVYRGGTPVIKATNGVLSPFWLAEGFYTVAVGPLSDSLQIGVPPGGGTNTMEQLYTNSTMTNVVPPAFSVAAGNGNVTVVYSNGVWLVSATGGGSGGGSGGGINSTVYSPLTAATNTVTIGTNNFTVVTIGAGNTLSNIAAQVSTPINGGGITNLNASQLSSGTVPYAVLPSGVLTNDESLPVDLYGSNIGGRGALNLMSPGSDFYAIGSNGAVFLGAPTESDGETRPTLFSLYSSNTMQIGDCFIDGTNVGSGFLVNALTLFGKYTTALGDFQVDSNFVTVGQISFGSDAVVDSVLFDGNYYDQYCSYYVNSIFQFGGLPGGGALSYVVELRALTTTIDGNMQFQTVGSFLEVPILYLGTPGNDYFYASFGTIGGNGYIGLNAIDPTNIILLGGLAGGGVASKEIVLQATNVAATGIISGNGSGLTNLNASSLASGTVPLAQLPSSMLTNNQTGSVAFPLSGGTTAFTVATNVLVVTNGNVGIGTTGPGNRLVVNGLQNANGVQSVDSTTGGSIIFSMDDGYGQFYTPSSQPVYFGAANALTLGIGINGGVSVGNDYYSTAAPVNGMIVQGNVGIGTASPTAKLQVLGADGSPSLTANAGVASFAQYVSTQLNFGGYTAYPYALWLQTKDTQGGGGSGSTYPLVLNPLGGNVGIGTATPNYLLDVNGTASVSNIITLRAGLASYASNTLAPTSIPAPATTVTWTNTTGQNIEVYMDNSGVTGTAIKKNGTQIFSSVLGDVTFHLQQNEWFSVTYTVGTPSITYSPY